MSNIRNANIPFPAIWQVLGKGITSIRKNWKMVLITLLFLLLSSWASFMWGRIIGYYEGVEHNLWFESLIDASLNLRSLEILHEEDMENLRTNLERILDINLSAVMASGGPRPRPKYIQRHLQNSYPWFRPLKIELYERDIARIARYREKYPSKSLFIPGDLSHTRLMSYLPRDTSKSHP